MLAIVLPLVGLFLLLVLCGGVGLVAYLTGLIGAEDPTEAVEDFFDAAVARDCDGMIDRVTEETWRQGGASNREQAISDCQTNLASVDVPVTRPISCELVSESGDTAVVRAVFPPVDLPELDPELDLELDLNVDTEVDYHLRKDGRRWLIDGTASEFPPGGLGAPPGGLPEVPGLETPGLETPEPSLPGTPVPPTAAELWGGWTDISFEIKLESRTLTGELHQLDSYDHPSCASAVVDPTVAIDLANCLGRIEAVYLGEHDGIRLSQQVFTFPDEDAAGAFVNHFDGVYAPDLVSFTDPGDIANSGYSESNSRAVGPYVVLTLMVSAAGDEDSVQLAQDHAHALHAETVNILIWGGP